MGQIQELQLNECQTEDVQRGMGTPSRINLDCLWFLLEVQEYIQYMRLLEWVMDKDLQQTLIDMFQVVGWMP